MPSMNCYVNVLSTLLWCVQLWQQVSWYTAAVSLYYSSVYRRSVLLLWWNERTKCSKIYKTVYPYLQFNLFNLWILRLKKLDKFTELVYHKWIDNKKVLFSEQVWSVPIYQSSIPSHTVHDKEWRLQRQIINYFNKCLVIYKTIWTISGLAYIVLWMYTLVLTVCRRKRPNMFFVCFWKWPENLITNDWPLLCNTLWLEMLPVATFGGIGRNCS